MRNTRDLLSANIKRLRDNAEFDQEDLAEAAGLSKSMIAQIEQKQTAPSPETIDKIVSGLNTSHAELFLDQSIDSPKPAPPKTISDMTPDQLEALVARAAKRDDLTLEIERLKLELAEQDRIIAAIDKRLFLSWPVAEEVAQILSLYFATGDRHVLKRLDSALRDKTVKFYESLGLKGAAKPRSSNR